ncbi:MAG: hypothetical protein KA715_07335 [Xanthomonadaceae bacterium]|nr:hypothetical protein [Xanthomonadaceae bacterium]
MMKLIAILAHITLEFLSVSPTFAAKYSKKKPKISKMMLGGANNSAQTPAPKQTEELAPPSLMMPNAAPKLEKKDH